MSTVRTLPYEEVFHAASKANTLEEIEDAERQLSSYQRQHPEDETSWGLSSMLHKLKTGLLLEDSVRKAG